MTLAPNAGFAAPASAFAQTPVQLYERLRRHGVTDADMRTVRAACGTGIRLFAGGLQGSGRGQLQHCVGVADILLELGAPTDLVAAGVVHSAYRRGDFGPWRVFLSQKRAWMRRQLGLRIERHVFSVHMLPWTADAVVELPGRFAALDDLGRGAVLLRLCDELESIGSGALNYCQDAEVLQQEALRRRPALISLARKLALPALDDALAAAVDDFVRLEIPPELRFRHAGDVVPPESATVRLEAIATGLLASAARRLRPRAAQTPGAPSPRRR